MRLDQYTPLRRAAYDMHGVETAARARASYRPVEGGSPVPGNPFTDVERATIAGIIALYCRSFTGRAKLPEKWWPKPTDVEDYGLHRGLLEARNHIYLHADHTAFRALFDPPGPDGLPTGEHPALIEEQIVAEVMLKVADLAAKQRAQFEAEVMRLWPTFQDVRKPSGSQSRIFDERRAVVGDRLPESWPSGVASLDELVALAAAERRGAIEELVRDRVREAVDVAVRELTLQELDRELELLRNGSVAEAASVRESASEAASIIGEAVVAQEAASETVEAPATPRRYIKCGEEKPVSEFDEGRGTCRACKAAMSRER